MKRSSRLNPLVTARDAMAADAPVQLALAWTGSAWPARPDIDVPCLWVGGEYPTNAPDSGAMRDGDTWIPATGDALSLLSTVLTAVHTASAVNSLEVDDAIAGTFPKLIATGTDTNISIAVTPKGSGSLRLGGTSPTIIPTLDSATNLDLTIVPKGTGGLVIYVASGQTPTIRGAGNDTNHDLNLRTQGTGVVKANGVEVVTLTGTQTQTNKTLTSPKVGSGILDTNGNTLINFAPTASAVNYLEVQNAAAGNTVVLASKGSDTNIGFFLMPKGTGAVNIYAAAGITPRLIAAGADTDVNLNIVSKGAGVVQINGVAAATKIAATASLDFGSIASQSQADLTITVTGAAVGDTVALGVPTAAVTNGIVYSAWVSATNTVTVRAHNYTGSAIDPASGTFKATVVR